MCFGHFFSYIVNYIGYIYFINFFSNFILFLNWFA